MALVKELGRGAWLHLDGRRKDPDKESLRFGRTGEFSPFSDLAFEKHLKRLDRTSKFYSYLNGGKVKMIIRDEKCWYPIMQKR